MATNEREFIAAKDLPVTEAEEVNVLVVDPATGELAQKAGANLGGEKADLVLAMPLAINVVGDEEKTVTIESGSLDAVVEALKAGRPPIVKCKHLYIREGFEASSTTALAEGGVYDCNVTFYAGYIYISFAIPHQTMVRIVMNISDADYLEVWLHMLVQSAVQVV